MAPNLEPGGWLVVGSTALRASMAGARVITRLGWSGDHLEGELCTGLRLAIAEVWSVSYDHPMDPHPPFVRVGCGSIGWCVWSDKQLRRRWFGSV